MSETAIVAIIVGAFGALVSVIQILGLWILNDIRHRVERLENRVIRGNSL
ncbi:MAG TPA: hypothetical protein VJY15_11355 [Candidatus Acidoferrum sp.]|nr:hypothetical protein [Candidatus Acidoferrum sp.]